MAYAYANGGVWGLGNGLVGSSLVVYLAGAYGAAGFAVSLVLAAPRLVGVLRLATPWLMDVVGNRRRFCLLTFFASSAALLALPVLSAPHVLPNARLSLAALVLLWTLYHLLEFLGVVALWSWFGDLVPSAVRGRFVGRRTAWTNAGRVVGMVVGGASTWWWKTHGQAYYGADDSLWLGYAVCAGCGAALLAGAVWPLSRMAEIASPSGVGQSNRRRRWQETWLPFADRRFRRLLVYGGWFSLANGITGSAQLLYQMQILEVSYAQRLTLVGTSRAVQSLAMPWVGALADRRGNVPVLVVSQLLVACGLLFFLLATPEHRWWLIGAFVLWIAYAGTNVAMPNLMLQLGRRACYASYAAAWFAWKELVYALSTLAGGMLFDGMSRHFTPRTWGVWRIDHFAALFLLGWILRMLGVLWAARIRE